MGRFPRTLIGVATILSLIASASAAHGAWDLRIEGPSSLAGVADRLSRLDPQPLEQALQRGGLTLPRTVRVALIAEDDSRARETPSWVVGQAFRTGEILIFPGRVASYPYDSLESVLRHEVVHLALFARADGRPLPRWFHEGVAVSVEAGWSVASNVRLLIAAATGPTITDVTRLFQSEARPDTTEAYLLATALVDDLRHRHGAAAPGAIAELVGQGLPFERAFELETGETPDQAATHAWATYRRLVVWLPFLTSPTAVWALILMLAFTALLFRLKQRARRRRLWDEEEASGAGLD